MGQGRTHHLFQATCQVCAGRHLGILGFNSHSVFPNPLESLNRRTFEPAARTKFRALNCHPPRMRRTQVVRREPAEVREDIT
jgi:hypothetical protein